MSDTKTKEQAPVTAVQPAMSAVQAVPLAGRPVTAAALPSSLHGAKTSFDEQKLIDDLGRILRYASTARQIEIPRDEMQSATLALQAAKSQLGEFSRLYPDVEMGLFQAVDKLSPRIYPVTAASLEIAQLMEVGYMGGDERQQAIRNRVKSLVSLWIYVAVNALFLSIFTAGAASKAVSATVHAAIGSPVSWLALGFSLCKFFSPMALGLLGACAYNLRNILQNLANQTFVLKEETTYALRAMLGITIGFMIPDLFPKTSANSAAEIFGAIAIPFLAGYAAEPMFAALDNAVTTILDLVSRRPPGSGRPKSTSMKPAA